MDALNRCLLELRADVARNPDAPDAAELSELLAEVVTDSDANLIAAAALLDLDREALEERAAIMEIDGSQPRTVANRYAVAQAIQERHPTAYPAVRRWFGRNASIVLEHGHKRDMGIDALRKAVHAYFRYRMERQAAADTEAPAAAAV